MFEFKKISEGDYSTLLGMNGGQPESPDKKLIIYARKSVIDNKSKPETELWICDRDTLENHRKVFDVHCGNHNGPSASFIDNNHIVFRDHVDGKSAFRILNVYTGEVIYGPIFGKESHCSENGIYPFSISDDYIDKNPDHPELNQNGIYTLNVATGEIKCVVTKQQIIDMVEGAGCTVLPSTTQLSHVQLNPSATKVMMRLGVPECKIFGALGEVDLDTGKTHLILDKPVHQLWFDDNSYMATRQYHNGERIEMETSRIQRFSLDGETLETLGGVGNHIDGSPDRQWFVGDRAYPDYPADILLYRRGETKPAAILGSSNYQHTIWKLQIHPNPTFSRDGKRVYFNRPVSDSKTECGFVDISHLL